MLWFKKFWQQHWLIITLSIFFISSTIAWIYLDQSPPLWDIAGHSFRSAALARGLDYNSIYPPLTYSITALGFWFVGFYADMPQYSLVFWLIVYCIALYYITLYFYQKTWLAAITVGLSLCYPLLAHFTRIYDLDFPLTALCTATIAMLLKTNQFTQRSWSILYGIGIGLTFLTKWTGLVFLLAPTTYALLTTTRRDLKNFGFSIASAVLVAGPWYWSHAHTIFQAVGAAHNNGFSVPFHNLWRPANSIFYAKQLVLGTSWPLALFWMIGLALFIIYHKKNRWLMIVSLMTPYFIMTFGFYSKESRYILPLLPLLAICTSALCVYVQNRWRWIMLGGCIVLALGVWYDTSWGTRLLPWQAGYGYQLITPTKPRFGFTYPTSYHTNLPTLTNIIIQDLQSHPIADRPIRLAVVPNSIFLTAQQIAYAMLLQTSISFDYSLSSQLRQGINWRNTISQADYVITKTGDQGPKVWQPNGIMIAQAESNLDPVFDQFILLYSATLNGIEKQPAIVRIYRKK